ncbi:MAG TPA: hypothetical protein GXX49_05520 [Clostridiaceae bacterium]|nr:hypothetical protein [Clostridiaceae bacterium]
MKKFLSVALTAILLFGLFNTAYSTGSLQPQDNPANPPEDAFPSQKEEVVYGILNLDGSVDSIYVVNIFNGGNIIDYGNYSEVRNLTTAEKINVEGDKISISTEADKFYYQGTLEKKELPWDISIKYFLDEKEIPGTEVAGKSGRLKIAISINPNINVNSIFFNNYALQVAVTLDSRLCSNIEPGNATVAEAGGKKQLTYTCLPGNSVDIILAADIHDFEMEPVSINGIKLSMDIPVDSDELSVEISKLTDAIGALDDGAGELLGGLNRYSEGMQKYVDGLKAFREGLGQLSDGAGKLNEGATALEKGLSMLTEQNSALVSGALAIQQATFDSINKALGSLGLELPPLTPENYSEILDKIPHLAAVKNQLDGVVQFAQGLKSYTEGVAQLRNGASELAKGTAEFSSSSSVIIYSANELYNAGAQLNMAAKELQKGLDEYKKGTKELRDGTSNMSEEISSKISELVGRITGGQSKAVSFVSEKNTNVTAVQFVLKTGSIKVPEAPKSAAGETMELTLWQKLLKLFSFDS